MRSSLGAGAEKCQLTGILARKQPGRNTADGGSPNGGDFGGIEQGYGTAVFGIKQHHSALMRLTLTALIARKQGYDLDPERRFSPPPTYPGML